MARRTRTYTRRQRLTRMEQERDAQTRWRYEQAQREALPEALPAAFYDPADLAIAFSLDAEGAIYGLAQLTSAQLTAQAVAHCAWAEQTLGKALGWRMVLGAWERAIYQVAPQQQAA